MRLSHSFASLILASAMLATPTAFAADAAKDSDVARTYTEKELQQIVIKTILDNPEVIIDSVERMQVKKQFEETEQARQAVKAYSTSLFEDKTSPYAGNPDGDVVVVEFFDYNCGYCKRSLPTVSKLIQDDKKVKVIFKDYPVLSPSSEEGARAALAMNKLNPDRYFDYHAALFNMGGRFDEQNLAAVAEGMGADKEEFIKTMKSDEITQQIEENRTLAAKIGARGVPVFIIGEEIIPGAASIEKLKMAVSEARASATKD